MATLDTWGQTAGLSAFCVLRASVMMEVPDVYVRKVPGVRMFQDNCACSLRLCIRLHFDVSASHTWMTGEERCATEAIEVFKQHARGTSAVALYLCLKGQNTKRGRGLLHVRALQQFSAVKYENNLTEKLA